MPSREFKFWVFWEATLRLIMVFNCLISATLWGRSSNVWEGKPPQTLFGTMLWYCSMQTYPTEWYMVIWWWYHLVKVLTLPPLAPTNQTAKKFPSSLISNAVRVKPHSIRNTIILGHQDLHSSSVTVYFLQPGMIQHFALECTEDQSSTVLTYPLHVIDYIGHF